jgi:hypothetical protein
MDNGADVINEPGGRHRLPDASGQICTEIVALAALDYAYAHGVVIAASGNDGGTVLCPQPARQLSRWARRGSTHR